MSNSKSTLRVLQVFTILNRGGAESMIMNYYRHIDRNKVQFDFLVHREERGVFEEEIESLGGKIYRMPAINPLLIKKYYRELDDFFKLHPYSIVHSHINTFSSFPLKVAAKNNIKCRISHAHTTTRPLSVSFIRKKPIDAAKILFKNIRKNSLKKYSTHLMACGEQAGYWLFGKSNYEVLPNAIDSIEYIHNTQTSVSLKKKYNLENNLLIGHIGNFSYPKNYPFILSVFKQIKKNKKESKLVLIGDGKLRNEIEKIAITLELLDDIIFFGVRSDVAELLQMMDVFLFPSHYEGLPVTLVEAQASGLKIFASDVITREVELTDDITFLPLDKSPEFWADQIIKAIPYERKDNSEVIKAKGYDVVENAKRLENFYLKQVGIEKA